MAFFICYTRKAANLPPFNPNNHKAKNTASYLILAITLCQ